MAAFVKRLHTGAVQHIGAFMLVRPPSFHGVTTVYVGGIYEKQVETGSETKYYHAGAQRVGMRVTDGMSGTLT